MFTDIAGYTAMVQSDEEGALEKVNAHREILSSASEAYSGSIVSFYGDGSLSTFSSAIDALNCAIRMQLEYIKREVPVRIGIHLGDIVFRQDSVFGDGVNLASRIQALGIPGSILISERMQAEIANHTHIKTRSIGSYRLKNVKRQVKVYAVANEGLNIPKRKRNLTAPIAAIIALLLIGYFVVVNLLQSSGSKAFEELREQRVAVRFMDYANIDGKNQLADMASHWITNRLGEIPDAEVVNYNEALNDPDIRIATATNEERQEFARKTKAVNVLEGTIFKMGDELVFEAKFVNLSTGETIERFDIVHCRIEDPMQGINDLSNQVQGWWASKEDNVYTTPNYESYQLYLRARDEWQNNRVQAKGYLIKSIEADESFVDPYFLLTEFYDNKAVDNEDSLAFARRDSMIDVISDKFIDLSPRLAAMLDVYEANAQGDLVRTYRRYQTELESDPFDIFVNTGGMVHSLEFVNKPEECIDLFKMIPADSLDIEECVYCRTRLRLAISSFIQMKEFDNAIEVSRLLPLNNIRNVQFRLKPFIVQGNKDSIDATLREVILADRIQDIDYIYPTIAWDMAVHGKTDLVEEYCMIAIDTSNETAVLVECNYLIGNYAEVLEILTDTWPLAKFKQYEYVLQYYARVTAQLGNAQEITEIRQVIEKLDNNDPYDYGKYAYLNGVMSAIMGEKNDAIDYLSKAYLKGYRFSGVTYQNDPDLKSVWDNPEFIALMNPLESSSSSFSDSIFGLTAIPPLPPPNGTSTTAFLIAIRKDNALNSSRSTLG